MIKNFICIKDCTFVYQPKTYTAARPIEHNFKGGMAYMINATYILGDKDDLHQIHRDSKTLIYGYASTKFIYKNFILEDDYFSINKLYALLFSMNAPISEEDAKIMRESLFKNSPKTKLIPKS